MSHYIGFTGQAVIKKEYRGDFGLLYRREYDRIKAPVFREYLDEYENGSLWLNRWEDYFYNDELPEKNKNSYDEDTGLFSYAVTFNMHNTEVYYAVTQFMELLNDIAEKELSRRTWDEFENININT